MKLIIALALATAALLAPAPAAASSNPFGCHHADRTPGVVTLWEFRHVASGMTRHRVTCMYGVRGHIEGAYWGDDGYWHEGITYPTNTGDTTDVVYAERPPGFGPTGTGALHAWHWTWYGDPVRSLPF